VVYDDAWSVRSRWEGLVIAKEWVPTPRVLYGIAGAFALAGLALRLAPAQLPREEPPLELPAATQPFQSQGVLGDEHSYAPIAVTNVFSQDRTPPKTRFVPEGRAAPDAMVRVAKPRRPAFRLYGITVTERGATALIDANPKVPGAELYRLGDAVGGAPITAITESTVVIRRSGGPLVLRLPPAARAH
jgi:Type II secretion system protein C